MTLARAAPLLAVVALLAPGSEAWARTFAIDYTSRAVVDPAVGFDTSCWPDPEPDDCAFRAAALEAEMVDLLAGLELESDPATVEVFQSMADMPSPRLQEISLAYFSGRSDVPTTFWGKVRAFFFGTDAEVGQPAAEVLAGSTDLTDGQLSQVYLQGRPSSTYGGGLPTGAGFDDSWAIGAARDSLLDQVGSFQPAELFPGATRLLMIDRFVQDPLALQGAEVPVTGFVTDAAGADVRAHFVSVFGVDPFPSVTSSQARYDAISVEMTQLQPLLVQGDRAAIARFQVLAAEAGELQMAITWGTRLGLEQVGAMDHEYWVDAPRDGFASGDFPRAVAAGIDPLVGTTVIRYFGGAIGTGAPGGNPAPGGGTIPPADPGTTTGKSGCGFSPGADPWALLALAAWLGRRRLRVRAGTSGPHR